MDISSLFDNWKPKKKTTLTEKITEKITEYCKENPTIIAKSLTVGVVSIYTLPTIISLIGWLPYLGAGWYAYNKYTEIKKSIPF
jgi:hypothetical protein